MMKKPILLTIVFILFFSCSEKEKEYKEPPTHSVLILNNFNPTNSIDYPDDFMQDEGETLDVKPISSGRETPPVIIKNPTKLLSVEEINLFNNISDTIRIFHSNDVMMAEVYFSYLTSNTYYLKAGDTIFVDAKDVNNIKEFYKNKNAQKGNLFPAYTKDTLADSFTYITYLKYPKKREKIKKVLEKDSLHYVNRIKKIDSLFELGQVSEDVYEIMKTESTFKYPKEIKTFGDGFVFDESKETLYKELIRQDKFIGLENYRNFVSKYAYKKYDIQIQSLGNGVGWNTKALFDSVYVSDIFGKNAKDDLLYAALNSIYLDYPEKVYLEYIEKFKKVVSDKTLITALESKKKVNFKEVSFNAQDVQIADIEGNKTTLSDVLEKHKGKVVYVDFWTSWCAPCIDALPKSKKLQKEYKNKDVVLVYINNEKEIDKWKTATKQYGLASENYYALNFPKAKFYQDLEFKSVPRYLLFDKNGKLVQEKAVGPNSDIIRGILNQLLEEN